MARTNICIDRKQDFDRQAVPIGNRGNPSTEACRKCGLCGLNRSMQHWLGVYSLEFESPRSLAGVD